MNTTLYNIGCFIAYMRYNNIFNYFATEETNANFICYVTTNNVDKIRNVFTTVERAVKSKKIGYNLTKNTYKVYLNKSDLMKSMRVIRFTKSGKLDKRFKISPEAAIFYVFFRATTAQQIKESKITPLKRIVFPTPLKSFI